MGRMLPFPSPFFENDEHGSDHHGTAGNIIPFQFFLQVDHRKDAKHDQGNHFLDGFQLRGVELVVSEAICRNLEAILHRSNEPTHQNRNPQRRIFVLEMPIPGDGHEYAGHGQQ